MNLTKIALILLVLVGVLLGGLILLKPSDEPEKESQTSSWNQPNAKFPDEFPALNDFFLLFHHDQNAQRTGWKNIVDKWQPGNAIMLTEMTDWLQQSNMKNPVEDLLVKKLELGAFNRIEARKKIWSEPVVPHPEYAEFKKRLFVQPPMDPRFGEYFSNDYKTLIRLDEIEWGGVKRDGIPPLVDPKMIAASEADYLEDSNVVFGVEINGDARAYPKRILAWHEMFRDTIGEEPVAGVYCTLCGTVIMYKTKKEHGSKYTLGTSGLLYRSNKLMYDDETKSLWSTLDGIPVVGPLAGKGIQLPYHAVVTTTWGEWKQRHPDTKVMSLDTGHNRDYGEGQAYKEYFATDDLMFHVQKMDSRLKNKDEILAIRKEGSADRLAISTEFLKANPVYHDQIAGTQFVVITDSSGANRAYQSGDVKFENLEGGKVFDSNGKEWTYDENFLTDGTRKLERFPAYRAFWFGWFSAFPETRLVK